MKPLSFVAVLSVIIGVVSNAAAQDEPGAYQAVMMRAAPGRLLDLIEAVKARVPTYQAAGEPTPIVLRHAQGDQWDLMVLTPIESLADYFGSGHAGRWQAGLKRTGFDDAQFKRQMDEWVSWREELYVTGPSVTALQSAAADAGYFHLEIFQALAGKRDSLRAERVMENDFLARIGKPVNFIFDKVTGAAWDNFTIGFYRDLQHYAQPAGVAPVEEDTAAKAAGFESRNHIGAYLRRFLSAHHDTLGSVVR